METTTYHLDDGTYLAKRSNRGSDVWARCCAQHRAGFHRYTLTDGTPCVDYWPTLDEARAALAGRELRAAE